MRGNKEVHQGPMKIKDHTWVRGVRGAMWMRVAMVGQGQGSRGTTTGDPLGEEMGPGLPDMEEDHLVVVLVVVGAGSDLDRLFKRKGGGSRAFTVASLVLPPIAEREF